MEREVIHLRDYLYVLWKKMWIIVLVTVLLATASGIISFYVIEFEYETYTTLMLSKPNANMNSNEIIRYDDVLLNQKLVTTYGEIAKSRLVSDEVIKNIGLNLTPKELSKKIDVSLVRDTEIIKITATDNDPVLATELANETAQVFMKYVKDIMKIENVQVIDKAQVPLESVRPKPIFNIALTGVLGALMSVFCILLFEYLDNTIKTPEDVERFLKLPVLGTIPKGSKRAKLGDIFSGNEIVTQYSVKSPTSEAFRTIRTNIQFTSIEKETKTIVITSSVPEEGKSTIISNLAAAMAQMNQKVLLIDSDLRKPRIHSIFGLTNIIGLTNILVGDLNYDDVVVSLGIGEIDILTSGPIPPNPAELLGSKRMDALIEKLKEDYDLILLDAPPVGLVTDAAVLSTIADGTILVCAADQVEIEAAKNAKTLLEKVNTKILGVVINKVPLNKSGYYNYSYYDYY